MSPLEEGKRATAMLVGKRVKKVVRHRDSEVLIEFEDGSRVFVDSATPVDLSITLAD